jgi:hypothetical protein
MSIPKFSSALVIDGKPDEEAWQGAAVFKDFIQTLPGDNVDPSCGTEVFMMYDEKHLYVAFKCWDERDKIRATVANRDAIFGEDNVRLWLDTYKDQRRAYILGFNPLGIQQDGMYTEGRGSDFSVDIVMESKGVIEDWGWSVEVKIPFKSLRYSGGKGRFSGCNAARNIDRLDDEIDQWMPDDRNISGVLIKHGKITGLDEIKYERTLEIVPSVTVSETGSRVQANEIPAGRFVNQPIKQDLGLTLKYTLSPNITLDATINPDYAEIEADAPGSVFPFSFRKKDRFFSKDRIFFSRYFTLDRSSISTWLRNSRVKLIRHHLAFCSRHRCLSRADLRRRVWFVSFSDAKQCIFRRFFLYRFIQLLDAGLQRPDLFDYDLQLDSLR